MLVDVKLGGGDLPEALMRMLGTDPVRHSQGIYTGCGFNFDHLLAPGQGFVHFWQMEEAERIRDTEGLQAAFAAMRSYEIPEYGVCDSPEQFLEKFGDKLREDQNFEYAVGITCVRKDDQPQSGGWRWHKWGGYIGKHTPQYEYLYDEDGIDEVHTFSVLRRRCGEDCQ